MQAQATLQVDMNGFYGCFDTSDKSQVDFNIHMSHLDAASLTPEVCRWACQSMGYPLAGVGESGAACLCSDGAGLASPEDTIDNCRDIPCRGDARIACGSANHTLVYKV